MRPAVFVSQRVEIVPDYGERRDCLDQNWAQFMGQIGYRIIPVPNVSSFSFSQGDLDLIKGVVLTGGNDLVKYGGDAPERDETERKLIQFCCDYDIPLVGVCRGMQLIMDYFGVDLIPVSGHAGTRHDVEVAGYGMRNVNSYHNFTARTLSDPLRTLARSTDGFVEALQHSEKNIVGLMWHPEREPDFSSEDISLFRQVLDCSFSSPAFEGQVT